MIILKCLVIYYLISTFVLINLLFNNNFMLGTINTETGEIKPSPLSEIIKVSIFWIIMIPKILSNNSSRED